VNRKPPPEARSRDRGGAESGFALPPLARWFERSLHWDRRLREQDSAEAYDEALRKLPELEPGSEIGHGAFATLADAEAHGLTGGQGPHMGFLGGAPLSLPGCESQLVIAAPGEGKDTCFVARNLVSNFDRSLFVNDPAGESLWMAHESREEMQGEPPVVIAPFGTPRPGIPRARINVFGDLIRSCRHTPFLGQAPLEVAASMIPAPAKAGENAWVPRDAQGLAADLIYYLVIAEEDGAHPGRLHDLFNGGTDALNSAFRVMEDMSTFGLDDTARRWARRIEHSPREAEIVIGEAVEHLRIYSKSSPLREVSSGDDLVPAELTERPRTVFLCIPGQYVWSSRQFTAAVAHYLFEGVAAAAGPFACHFLMNEFSQMGFIPSVRKALRLYRKNGVQFSFFAQSRAALEDVVGAEGRRDIEENVKALHVLSTGDPDLIRDLGVWGGIRPIISRQTSLSGGSLPAVNTTIAETTRPLLQPENIRTLELDEQLLKLKRAPIFLLERRPWFEDDDLRAILRDPREMPGIITIPKTPLPEGA
jgi:type IV secretory pathway TraG/TraD family ATPase VirD4